MSKLSTQKMVTPSIPWYKNKSIVYFTESRNFFVTIHTYLPKPKFKKVITNYWPEVIDLFEGAKSSL
ncbi:MAG: hypothetical protein MK078_01005 [Crocinitomicaceae bacterium]|nr:hypothetical protein [Crocinitomicaceae bacterium]